MQTVTVELPDKLVALLDGVCLENGKVKQEVLKELIIQYLEDIEDAIDAVRVLEKNEPGIPLEDIERKYGLAD